MVKSFQIGLSVKSKVTYVPPFNRKKGGHRLHTKVIFALLCLYKKKGIKYLRKELSGRKKRHEGNKSKANLQYIVQFANGVIGLTGWGHKGNLCLISI